LYTGDLVNNVASEMHPWKETFGKLKAKDGTFSVLGNHDYGDYAQWSSDQEKTANLEELKQIQKEMGFDLLLNENRFLEKDGQRIALIGDRKSTRLNSSHVKISYAVYCLKKKKPERDTYELRYPDEWIAGR